MRQKISRRQFNALAAVAPCAAILPPDATCFQAKTQGGESTEPFEPKYLLASSLYGFTYIGDILPEVKKSGAIALDIWPKHHANQREQLDDLGIEKFKEMLVKNQAELGCITQYKLGPYQLAVEFPVAHALGCKSIVTGAVGPATQTGGDTKVAVGRFVESMKRHVDAAGEHGIKIAIENHANSLISSPDSIKWLAELGGENGLRVALAPYHLSQDAELIADLIRNLGNRIEVFYAWQYGKGCADPMPTTDLLLQLPGKGELDFKPIISALKEVEFNGWIEIFMHPVPRGISILPSIEEVTGEINKAREYITTLNQ